MINSFIQKQEKGLVAFYKIVETDTTVRKVKDFTSTEG